jgi:hypothetical protein
MSTDLMEDLHMLEELYKREIYGPEGALQIEDLGRIAVSIANRWQLGWPKRVKALMDARIYMVNLDAQMELELDVVVDAVGLGHLTHHELMQLYGVDEAPPTCEQWDKSRRTFASTGTAIYPLPTFVQIAGPLTEDQIDYYQGVRERQATYTW